MIWEAFALRYATADRNGDSNLLGRIDLHDTPMPIDYYVWLLRSGDTAIVVDTGFSPAGGQVRGRALLRTVGEALGALHVDPARVQDVIITHLHYDHAGELGLFPGARFHLQEREMAFATGRHMCAACIRYAYTVDDVVDMVRAVYADRVVFHNGKGEVAPGVTLHRVGGHTRGLQMVRVETARGPVVLASDAAHFYANLRTGTPFPIVFDMGEMASGWAKARRLAGGDESRIVPGHDPLVRALYPSVPGTDGEVVKLHEPPGPEP